MPVFLQAIQIRIRSAAEHAIRQLTTIDPRAQNNLALFLLAMSPLNIEFSFYLTVKWFA